MKPLKLQKELTIRDSWSLDKYFSEISKYKALTADEERLLCERISHGDKEAKELLILHNLRFVISVAKRYQSLGYRLSDLVAIGNIGMLRAVETFDYTKGFKFISYAVWWIRQQILSETGFRNNGIRIPGNRVSMMYKIKRWKDWFFTQNQREPMLCEIAEEFDVSEDVLSYMLVASEDISSLDMPLSDDSDAHTMSDLVSSDEDFEDDYTVRNHARDRVRQMLVMLEPVERLVIECSYGIDCNEMEDGEIASLLGIKKGDVVKIKERAISRMSKM